jgi:hypothetical protein
MTPIGTPAGVSPPTSGERVIQDPRLFLGTVAVLAWFVALTMTDFAHDALGIAGADPSTHPAAHIGYELASGYVLGVVAAFAIALLGGLLRTRDAEGTPTIHPLLRQLARVALFIVALACITGAAVHNADGITLLYDIAFATGLILVFVGVVPLHQHMLGTQRDGA